MRRFWNHTFTCASVSLSVWARYKRSGPTMYCCRSNSASKHSSCSGVKIVRTRLFFSALFLCESIEKGKKILKWGRVMATGIDCCHITYIYKTFATAFKRCITIAQNGTLLNRKLEGFVLCLLRCSIPVT